MKENKKYFEGVFHRSNLIQQSQPAKSHGRLSILRGSVLMLNRLTFED